MVAAEASSTATAGDGSTEKPTRLTIEPISEGESSPNSSPSPTRRGMRKFSLPSFGHQSPTSESFARDQRRTSTVVQGGQQRRTSVMGANRRRMSNMFGFSPVTPSDASRAAEPQQETAEQVAERRARMQRMLNNRQEWEARTIAFLVEGNAVVPVSNVKLYKFLGMRSPRVAPEPAPVVAATSGGRTQRRSANGAARLGVERQLYEIQSIGDAPSAAPPTRWSRVSRKLSWITKGTAGGSKYTVSARNSVTVEPGDDAAVGVLAPAPAGHAW